MPLDLNAARALHDRDPDDPEACPTCIHPENPHQMARWPCATALALGATGRTEWEDQPTTSHRTGAPSHCQERAECEGPSNHPGHCTTPNDPDIRWGYIRCGSAHPLAHEPACVLRDGHETEHVNQEGDSW